MKKLLILFCFVGALASVVLYVEGQTVRGKHPNLAAAQSLIDEAFAKISDAQKANEFDMEGHAGKAKDFLEKASKELKLAAAAAEANAGGQDKPEQKRADTDETAKNINPKKHPNLAKAQQLINDAHSKITDAQKVNEFDLGGHAARAKDFLEKASEELKLAALAANKN